MGEGGRRRTTLADFASCPIESIDVNFCLFRLEPRSSTLKTTTDEKKLSDDKE